MLIRRSPFLPFFEQDSGAGTTSGGTVLGANALPSTNPSVPADQRSLQGPTSAASRGVDAEGLSGDDGGSGSASQNVKFFSEDFDPNTLPAALREPFSQMREQFQTLSQNIPPADVLSSLRTRADAFDKIAQSEDFRRFLNQGGNPEASEASEEDLGQIEGLEPEAVKALQRIIDQGIQKGIQPVLEHNATERAKTELEKCDRDFGEDFRKRETDVHQRMLQYGIPARQAYLQIMGEQAIAGRAQAVVRDIQEKQGASTVGDGSPGAVTPPTNKRARNMREAMEQAEEQYLTGEAFDPRTYALQAGHV